MKKKYWINYWLLFLFTFLCSITFAQNKPQLDKIDKAVVVVLIYDYYGNYIGHGSGFIIDPKGIVVTNYHVVKDAYSLKVRINNNGFMKDYEVENIISGDESIDLAKISIKNTNSVKFPYLKLSSISPKKGDACWTIGTPAEIEYMNTVSEGIISNIYYKGIALWSGRMLQLTAPFTHGSSGGALVNEKGEVIGVTSGLDPGSDGARANINWAISSYELNNLKLINKKSITRPEQIPCQLAFYTNDPYTGNVFLYVDRVFIGSFTKYYPNNFKPSCGDDGTITKYLYRGTHTYQVYFAAQDKWYSGTITLDPGECQIFRVGGGYNSNSNSYPNQHDTNSDFFDFDFTGKKILDRGSYSWVVSTGLSFLDAGGGMPFPLFVEKYFNNNKYSLRGNIQFLNDKNDENNISKSYFGIGLDLKRIYYRPYRWNYFIAGTANYRTFSVSNQSDFKQKYNYTYIGGRFGGDCYVSKRFYLTVDIGLGYQTLVGEVNSDMNILFGYRFK